MDRNRFECPVSLSQGHRHPLTSRPSLMVVGLFQFMAIWNDFLGPLIYLTDQKDFTLALGLQFFQSQQGGTEWHYLMAASTLVAAPLLLHTEDFY